MRTACSVYLRGKHIFYQHSCDLCFGVSVLNTKTFVREEFAPFFRVFWKVVSAFPMARVVMGPEYCLCAPFK